MNNPAQTHNCATCINCFVYGILGDGSFRKVCIKCFMKTIKNNTFAQNLLEKQKDDLIYNSYAVLKIY